MAGGNPFEIYNLFGFKVPRYRVALYTIGLYAGIFFTISTLNGMKGPAPVTFESPEQEKWAKEYAAFKQHESHKPLLLRSPFTKETGLN
ncbi:hypothetical protein EDD86DRAFT_200516 [Gorgonomyces haynaldii]|nr:hypothetical protein EDD86DRAFT_200516 [Gorgonomyces haynaldii]